jgi:hypothetical protein
MGRLAPANFGGRPPFLDFVDLISNFKDSWAGASFQTEIMNICQKPVSYSRFPTPGRISGACDTDRIACGIRPPPKVSYIES